MSPPHRTVDNSITRKPINCIRGENTVTDVSSQGPARRDDRRVLTNRQGHPVYDNQNQRTVGPRGPATLENYQFLEKISHFDRERIPERVVHARGFVAYGYFEATGKWGDEPITNYTRAKLFAEPGKRTDVASGSPRSSVDATRRKPPAIREVSRSSSTPRTVTGILSETTSRSSSFATRSSSPTSSIR